MAATCATASGYHRWRMPPRKTRPKPSRAHAEMPLPALQFSQPLPYGAVLHDKGVQFVGDTPETLTTSMVDFAGRRFDDDISFTFSHPSSIVGILFEFIEYPDGFATP